MAVPIKKDLVPKNPETHLFGKFLKITGAFTLTAGIASVPAGVWDENSNNYYRELTQNAVLNLAERFQDAPKMHATVSEYTKWAFRFHRVGITTNDVHRLAHILAKIDRKDAAAQLGLGLTNQYYKIDLPDAAKEAAIFSQGLKQSENALLSIVMLSSDKEKLKDGTWISDFPATVPIGTLPSNQTYWYQKLLQYFPSSSFITIKSCIDNLKDFGNPIPGNCLRIDWLQATANKGQSIYVDLSRRIDDLPRVAAENIRSEENVIRKESEKRDSLEVYKAQIEKKKSSSVFDHFVDFIVGILPIPKSDDTAATYIARETACFALPTGTCTVINGVVTFFNILSDQDKYTKILQGIDTADKESQSTINGAQSTIRWWGSSGPQGKLEKEQRDLVPAFKDVVHQKVKTIFIEPGIPLNPILETVISSPN